MRWLVVAFAIATLLWGGVLLTTTLIDLRTGTERDDEIDIALLAGAGGVLVGMFVLTVMAVAQ